MEHFGCLEQDKEIEKMKAKAAASGEPYSIRKHAQTSQIDDSFKPLALSSSSTWENKDLPAAKDLVAGHKFRATKA